MKQLDRFQRWLRDGTYRPPTAVAELGAQLISVGEGEAVFELTTEAKHMGPQVVHGGVICTIADVAMATSAVTLLEVGEGLTTVELKINFLRAVPTGVTLAARGRVIKAGRTLSLTECHVTDAAGQLYAHATSTCMTLRRPPATTPSASPDGSDGGGGAGSPA